MSQLLSKFAKYFAYGVLAMFLALMGYVIFEITVATERFANRLITRSLVQTERELNLYIERVEDLISAFSQQYRSGFWSGLSTEKVILHNLSIVDNYAPVSSIGIADLRGFELNILPDSTEGDWITRSVFFDRWGPVARWERWTVNGGLQRVDEWEDSVTVDPRDRPWFKGAVEKTGEVYWTNPYEFTTSPDIGMTASIQLPADQHADSLSRILAFDLTLKDLNSFFGRLHLTENQNVFLLTADRQRVIAQHRSSNGNTILPKPEDPSNRILLRVLNQPENRNAFQFTVDGEQWWGILKPYNVSENLQFHIVSVLPERDFAMEFNRTIWVGSGSFILILLLAALVVMNHNKLHRISNVLQDKNILVTQQKEFLFSEVHHRVKNNLALISAFLELDILNMNNPSITAHLQKNQRRIKVIAVIQEEVYKSSDLGSVTMKRLTSGVAENLERRNSEITCRIKSERIDINVNQALTFGLLLHELLDSITSLERTDKFAEICIKSVQRDKIVHTEIIGEGFRTDGLQSELESDIIRAYLSQLNVDMELIDDENVICRLSFELVMKSGIVGNRHY